MCVLRLKVLCYQVVVGKRKGRRWLMTLERRKLAAAIAALDPDFHGLLERKEVTQRVQGRLSNANVKSVSRFVALGDASADLKDVLHGNLGIRQRSGCRGDCRGG